jgi:fructoselysine-6-P-deglycase FrlB-like protein
MIYATIFLAVILILCIARIYFLNSEVRELDLAGRKLSNETEREWATNARDSKKESRTIWLGASAMALIALIAAIVELSQNSY